MSQQLLMEAKAEVFTVNPEYEKFVPRPTYDQYRALEQDILAHGQLEPIKVNPKMIVLDGHTRYQILGDRGMRIKYIIINPEDEIAYMISLNVMRRNLNDFQRIETMYDHFKKLKLQQREKNFKSRFDILYVLKQGDKSSKEIHDITGYTKESISRILLEYTKDYTVSRKKRDGESKPTFVYNINPRGEKILVKGKPKIIKGVETMVGKLIGMSRMQVTMGVYIIESKNKTLMRKLRNGSMTIGGAHRLLGEHRGKCEIWKRDSKIECPHCHKVAKKTEYKLL